MSEYKYIKDIIPNYDRYIEPFFGGGAIFFREEPEKAFINDYNSLLMDFYRLIKEQNEEFKNNLYTFAEKWNEINGFLEGSLQDKLVNYFYEYRKDKISNDILLKKIKFDLENRLDEFNGMFKDEFAVDKEMMFEEVLDRVFSKLKRMKKVEDKKDNRLPEEDIIKNIETGFKGGFYTHFRNILNDCNLGRKNLSKEKHIAIFYFIREFCYGSMFRYNSRGEFNIPYGGMSYNDKNFWSKIERLFNSKIKMIFDKVKIYDLDFEEFLVDRIDLTEDDFIFFDPPYDTSFSTYGGNPFNKKDHERLADSIERLDAKSILIIKETDFIRELYSDRGLKITSFDKLYSYNVRGRNKRSTEHLIITSNISSKVEV